jgi:hypothetical protein
MVCLYPVSKGSGLRCLIQKAFVEVSRNRRGHLVVRDYWLNPALERLASLEGTPYMLAVAVTFMAREGEARPVCVWTAVAWGHRLLCRSALLRLNTVDRAIDSRGLLYLGGHH